MREGSEIDHIERENISLVNEPLVLQLACEKKWLWRWVYVSSYQDKYIYLYYSLL